MKNRILFLSLLASGFLFTMSSCTKKDDPKKSSSNGTQTEDFSLFNTWTCKNADLPTKGYRDMYKDMTFSVNESDMSYSWKWNKKDGTVTNFTGYIAQSQSKYSYNGQPLWNISVNVTHINGQSAPGGWSGIYASTGVKSFTLNVEPKVSGVKSPTAEEGIGSGQTGSEAVFKFTR